ncbi:MAG: hypothetical protein LBO78_02660 [Rickettsiales bacterium]|jgi:hypothetical protein|nr:hypothetical protein [Rickettsiales bacterium]
MDFSTIDLCSKALHKIGASEIVSFDEATPEAEMASGFYPSLKARLLAAFPWSFATVEARLSRLAEKGGSGYAFAFALPNGFLRAVRIAPSVPYKIMGGRLLSNAGELALLYVADVPEENFSPAFASALVYALAAEFSTSLLNDAAKFNLFYKLHMIELKEAKFLDSAGESPKGIKSFPLIDARK